MDIVARERAQHQLAWLETHADRLVIDADTHASDCSNLCEEVAQRYRSTPDYYHGRPTDAEGLVAEMDLAQVDMCLIWQNPAATVYPGDPSANADALRKANEYLVQTSRRFPTRFIPAGWTDPRNLGVAMAVELVDWCVLKQGLPIVKLNPAQNAFAVDSDTVISVVERIVELGAVPAFHFGADTPYTPVAGFEKLARRFCDSPVIGVHMGGGGASYVAAEEHYIQTRAMGLRNPNVVFLLSARRDTHSESDFIAYQGAGEPYCHNLCCASDAPYGRITFNFGGFRAMLSSLAARKNHPDPRIRSGEVVFSSSHIQRYLGGNIARLTAKAYRAILAQNG